MNRRLFVALPLIIASITATAATTQQTTRADSAAQRGSTSYSAADWGRTIPVQGWNVDVLGGIATLGAQGTRDKTQTKAASDPSTVFRPVSPCRLIDTRGFPAFLNIGGTFAPGERRTAAAGGLCGVPSAFVKGISVTLITFNNTPNSGGTISLLPPGGVRNAVTDIFNPGTSWASTAYNVPTSSAGAFDIVVDTASPEVIIDVNGYYQDLDSVDVGAQELDVSGSSVGDLFEVTQNGTGSALSAGAFGAGAKALTLYGGAIRVAGAGPNTATPAFIHQSVGRICAGDSKATVITHTMLDGDPNALLFVTARVGSSAGPFEVAYAPTGCPAGKWAIRDKTSSIAGDYNVLVIKN